MPGMHNAQTPWEARVVTRTRESATVVSLGLQFTDVEKAQAFHFQPGQFNMLYLYGIGEVPISIVSDPGQRDVFIHTIRAVGRVTRKMTQLQVGDTLGIRGPFGQGWPLEQARGDNILLTTGGLGCAPSVSVINYIMQRREQYGDLTIIQGVKHMDDLIWRDRYEQWMQLPNTRVLLAADVAGPSWTWHVGLVTDLLAKVDMDVSHATIMLCGPEPMMVATVQKVLARGADASKIWLSMERNMQCAVGLCGHCQYGPEFVCRDGPVLPYSRLQQRLGKKGY
jgi:NAD(P)H-flavin reductase